MRRTSARISASPTEGSARRSQTKNSTFPEGPGSVLAIDYGGKGYLTRGDMLVTTLSGGRNKGVFTTKTFDGKPISGTFTC